MKKSAILFTLAFMLFSVACDSPPPEPYPNLSGTVFDAATGEPIDHAALNLMPNTGASSTYSDDSGKYCFRDLKSDDYTLQVQKAGYYETNRKSVKIVINKENVMDIPMTRITQ
jgi:hypothetical protein